MFLLAFFMMCDTFSQIFVSPTIINFFPDELPRQDVVVTNEGNETVYLSIKAYRVNHPGTKIEKKVTIHDPSKLKFIVSPTRMIIPPKQHRLLRLMKLASPQKQDSIYRIEVVPIPKQLLPVKEKFMNKRRIGIRIILAYGILVIVRPQHIKQNIQLVRNKTTLFIVNQGNTNFNILSGKQCQNDKCMNIPSRRMYAGNRWKINLLFDQPVTLRIKNLGHIKKLYSN